MSRTMNSITNNSTISKKSDEILNLCSPSRSRSRSKSKSRSRDHHKKARRKSHWRGHSRSYSRDSRSYSRSYSRSCSRSRSRSYRNKNKKVQGIDIMLLIYKANYLIIYVVEGRRRRTHGRNYNSYRPRHDWSSSNVYSSPSVQREPDLCCIVDQQLREKTLRIFGGVEVLHPKDSLYTFVVDRANATAWTLTGFEHQVADTQCFSNAKGWQCLSDEIWPGLIPAKERLQIQMLATMYSLVLFGGNASNYGSLLIYFLNGNTMVVGRDQTKVWEMQNNNKK